ncbi:von Willebrand factor A domain-containing protein 5A-like protein [Cricetulus griseus]|uniref:von Willebrand factor A domain-containing protein 5A-like protein n=1 Tax=Cricetulus griseus TaxID=10029 RepID=A0A061I5K2_CRIGR|nr:von Willebrand factor A domain-containing protein 5A-like protein [Cricetulus griseus]
MRKLVNKNRKLTAMLRTPVKPAGWECVNFNVEEKENKEYLKSLFEILILMGKQNIPLDAHEANEIPDGFFASDNFQALLECRINSGKEVLRKLSETTVTRTVNMEHQCGLITGDKEPVPLKSISVTLSIDDFVAGVSATLNYENKEEIPVEAIFVFPLDEDSAVYSFEALVDGKKIVAELQEKTQAQSKYEGAISQGHQAYLLEGDDYSRDVFSCNIGNLLPGAKVGVTLRYVQELPLDTDGALRYVLPAILNPRYQLSEQSVNSSLNMKTPIVPLEALPYTLSMVATITSQHGIERVQSNCSLSPIQYLAEDKTSVQVSLAEGHKFDRDVELLIYYSEVHSPSVAVEMGMQDMKPGSVYDH